MKNATLAKPTPLWRLKEKLHRSGIPLAGLAARTGYNSTYLSKVLNGLVVSSKCENEIRRAVK